MLFDDISDLFYRLHSDKKAEDIAKPFNRDRKFIYFRQQGLPFNLNYDFIAGLNYYGYDLKLVKIDKGGVA